MSGEATTNLSSGRTLPVHERTDTVIDQRTALVLGWLRPERELPTATIEAAFAQSRSLSRSRRYISRHERAATLQTFGMIACCLAVLAISLTFALAGVH